MSSFAVCTVQMHNLIFSVGIFINGFNFIFRLVKGKEKIGKSNKEQSVC